MEAQHDRHNYQHHHRLHSHRVIYWAIQQLLALVPMPKPIKTIVRILLIVLLVELVIWIIIQLLAIVGIAVPIFGNVH
jgi:hypothetical protein